MTRPVHTVEVIILLLCICPSVLCVPAWYTAKREDFVREEMAMRIGAGLTLNAKEARVNERLMTLKKALVEKSLKSSYPYPPSVHFFKVKSEIDRSEIFRMIQKMPKGGALHFHAEGMTSFDWLIKNLTYDPTLYSMYDEFGTRHFLFSNETPGGEWRNVEEERNSNANPEIVDTKLMEDLSIWTDDPAAQYPSINDVWAKYHQYFISRTSLLGDTDREIRYIMQGIFEAFQDGLQYLELRIALRSEDFFDKLMKEVDKFKTVHPSFIGIKIIIAKIRFLDDVGQLDIVKSTLTLREKYPDLIKGFDLVGQEDTGKSLFYYIDALLYPIEKENTTLPFFFNAGETDWTHATDMNLVDAILLNTTRIGNGLAALRHPKVMEVVRKKGIVIELNPVSNQVLGLVSDLRNHPGAILFAEHAPVVISSDVPHLWNASPMSHDFYMAFMALGGVQDDLRLLKQLAINSITFSTMNETEKQVAMSKWQTRWDMYINDMVESI